VNSNTFKCSVCDEDHLMPEKGLIISKRFIRILALKSKEVYRGQKVEKIKEFLNGFKKDINSFGSNNGVDQIKEVCLNLKFNCKRKKPLNS